MSDKDKLNNLQEAPTYESPNNINYNCTECSSLIEILEINKEIIKFKCINNKHERIMEINKYLEKMKKYNDIKINNDKCNMHNDKYISYCFNCNKHLCNECLKNREHTEHYKNYIIELKPKEEELNLIKKLINENKKEKKNLEIERDNKYEYLKEKLKTNEKNIEKLKKKKKNKIEKEKDDGIKKNSDNFKNEIKLLKKKK